MDVGISGRYDKVGIAGIVNTDYSPRYCENVERKGRDWCFLPRTWTSVVEKFPGECGYVFGSGDCEEGIGYLVLDWGPIE